MTEIVQPIHTRVGFRLVLMVAAVAVALAAAWKPHEAVATIAFTVMSLLDVAPLVGPGILISAWISASGASGRIAGAFDGHLLWTVLSASAIGAITPVCGVTVLPLMVGLLASGVPLAPILAFWLSSPVTDPAMLAATAATLGWPIAIGKTLAAFGLGLLGGGVVAALGRRLWIAEPLRRNGLAARLGVSSCSGPAVFDAAVWATQEGRARWLRDVYAMSRLVLLCLVPAFAAEHLLAAVLEPQSLAAYVGAGNWWAVPLAVLVAAPAYLDGYAALPLTRGLMDHGMDAGAAMAFLVSGGAVSIWGAMAIFPVLRTRPFLLYLELAVIGSLASGWLYGLVA